jgi:uncharacterized protein (DUF58 family)
MRELRGDRYIDLTKDTQFNDAWILLGVVITLIGILFDNQFLTAAALVLFVIAAVSRIWTQFSLFGLHYRRRFSETRAFLDETIELTLEVRNQKFIPLTWLQIVDSFPTDLIIEGEESNLSDSNNAGELRTFWMIGPFQRLTRHFTIRCTHRGYHSFGPATISTGDGFGLFDRKVRPPEYERIIVYPKLYSAAELALPAKNPFGEAAARRRLFEDPLRTGGIRNWESSDDLRRVHWKATARHQKLLSRMYEPSHDPQMIIMLNVATLPRYWQGIIPELLERAISVAGSLAALCIERRMPVGLVANGVLSGSDQPIRLLPGRNPDQLVRILELLAAIQPLAAGQMEKTLLHESPRLPWGATMLVVSAVVTEELMAALLELDHAGRQIVLFTLAEAPPSPIAHHTRIIVYHLSQLVDDLIIPQKVSLNVDH